MALGSVTEKPKNTEIFKTMVIGKEKMFDIQKINLKEERKEVERYKYLAMVECVDARTERGEI